MENPVKLVAFCGSKGAGKNTSADIFKEIYGKPTEEIAIAGPLKDICCSVFDITTAQVTDPNLKEAEFEEFRVLDKTSVEAVLRQFDIVDFDVNLHVRPHVGKILKTPRSLLQYIGTEVLHPLDPLVHVKKALKQKDPETLTIVTDLRFTQEFDFFSSSLDRSFVPVYVKNSAAELKASVDPHPSERELELFKNKCYLLPNEGSLNELRTSLTKFYGEIFNE